MPGSAGGFSAGWLGLSAAGVDLALLVAPTCELSICVFCSQAGTSASVPDSVPALPASNGDKIPVTACA